MNDSYLQRASVDRSRCTTFVDLLRTRASQQADQLAYTFLNQEGAEHSRLTYGELDRHAQAIGAMLQRLNAAGQRVLLLYPPGLEYVAAFFGCLYAGATAVPAYPPNPSRLERTLPRLAVMIHNAQPAIALTTSEYAAQVATLAQQSPAFQNLHWLATDTGDEAADAWRMPQIDSATLAFLQYTSGSTAAPKGIMLNHSNLLHNSALIERAFGHTPDSRGVIWLPPYHDMGLIGGILQPLYAGFPVTLMSPIDFLQRPIRWLQAISRYRATTSGGPNFAYDLCVRRIPAEQRHDLDLSSWQVAFNGAEPIRHDTLQRFAEAFAACGFRPEAFLPCYGLAEATLIVTGGRRLAPTATQAFAATALENNRAVTAPADSEAARVLVSCGQPIAAEQTLLVVDPQTLMPCAPDQIGEIWVAGPSVAQGYWNLPAETAHAFRAFAANGAEPFLRTGDLGLLQHGELFITGRLKDLIIIRGRNHYPQDIELTVERSHPLFRPGAGAAFSIEEAGEERLVIVQEVDRHYRKQPLATLVGAIRQAVAEQHEIQPYAIALIAPGSIAKTSSGKIQRHACRAAFLNGTLKLVGQDVAASSAGAAVTEHLTRAALDEAAPEAAQALLATYLRAQVAGVLGSDPAHVDPDQALGTLGLDSLMSIQLQHTLETDLALTVPMVVFLQEQSIAQLAHDLNQQLAATPALPAIQAATAPSYPLSVGQRAIWFLHQLAPESPAYTIARAMRITGDLDPARLRRALQALIDRHPALRTVVRDQQGAPQQEVQESAEVCLIEEDAAAWDAATLSTRLSAEANRPFDLEHGPVFRLHLFRHAPDEHTLLVAVHHIIADLWSLAVLMQELRELYTSEQRDSSALLAESQPSYRDFMQWQAERLASAEGERLWSYWQQQLAGATTVIDLQFDRPRPPVQTYRGATHTLELSAELTQQLKQLTRSTGTTFYTLLLAAFQVLLHRYTGEPDLLVASPTAGRNRPEWAQIVGYFVNPIVLRSQVVGKPNFASFLAQTRQTVLSALAHQDYPFPLLVERLQPERHPSFSPLCQVAFAFQKAQVPDDDGVAALTLGEDGPPIRMGALQLETIGLEQQAVQFDLVLSMAQIADRLHGSLQYNADLFDAATIDRMAEHLHHVLAAIVADPEQPLATIPLLTEAERQQLLVTWNQTSGAYPQHATIHQLFAAQAARTPDATAVCYAERALSYRELNERANRLAHYLKRVGVGGETCVGIFMERSPELIVALLGVLKAGGAFLPLDPSYPADRLQFMLADSRPPVVLVAAALPHEWLPPADHEQRDAWSGPALVHIDQDWAVIAHEPDTEPASPVHPDNLAYVLYTSGSTGRPKAVGCHHRGVMNLLADWGRHQPLTGDDRCSCWTSLSFDVSVLEIFSGLLAGAALDIVPETIRPDPLSFVQWLDTRRITSAYVAPFMLGELERAVRGGDIKPALRKLTVGVEPIAEQLLASIIAHVPGLYILNAYGPTEATVCVTFFAVPSQPGQPRTTPIGKPMQNMQIYLLDPELQPVPIGVAGELYIGGVQLARGYLNRPDMTAERFIPDPFVSATGTAGGRLYRTGDLARYLPDGTIQYLRRNDHQVKLRGFRVEPGEIEAVLRQHPQVKAAAVVVREDTPGGKRLVAYVTEENQEPRTKNQEPEVEQRTKNQEQENDTDPTLPPSPTAVGEGGQGGEGLRAFLKNQLPDYMVPSAFVFLDALPLSPNGKLDRKALPAPLDDDMRSATFVAPRTPVETALAEIWATVLGIGQIGVHDSFFALGGHSLLATQMIARVRESYQIDLPLRTAFETATIAELAAVIEKLRHDSPRPSKPSITANRRDQYRIRRSMSSTASGSEQNDSNSSSGSG